jgi:hypothetical protein
MKGVFALTDCLTWLLPNGTVIEGRCALPPAHRRRLRSSRQRSGEHPSQGHGNKPGAATGVQAGFDSPRCRHRQEWNRL